MNKIIKNAKFLIPVIAVIIIGISFSGKDQDDYAKLQKMLDSALKENQELKSRLNDANSSIRGMDMQLKGLKDNQTIKDALISAEGSIDKLNKELKLISDENVALRVANTDLKNRLKDVPDVKTIKGLDQLKATKEELQSINKSQIEPLRQNIQFLEKKVKSLEDDRASLEGKLAAFNQEHPKQDGPVRELKEKVNALNSALSEKDTQIFKLETKIAGLQEQLNISRQEVMRTKDLISQNGPLENKVKQAENDLAKQKAMISVLTEEKEKLDLEVTKLRALSNDSSYKENMDKISSVLVKKELELEKARRETSEYKDKIANFQSRIGDMEKNLVLSDKALSKANDLEARVASLEAQLKESQTALKDKTVAVDTLQKNLDELTRQKKDIELRVGQLDGAKTDSQKELFDTKAKLEEISTLYNGLKTQASEISGVLAQKEMDLDQKRKELNNLNDEIAGFKTRSTSLEKELTETKERQRKTLDDLAQAIKLNAVLQNRILEVSKSAGANQGTADAKKKADELKKKIEVILEPEK